MHVGKSRNLYDGFCCTFTFFLCRFKVTTFLDRSGVHTKKINVTIKFFCEMWKIKNFAQLTKKLTSQLAKKVAIENYEHFAPRMLVRWLSQNRRTVIVCIKKKKLWYKILCSYSHCVRTKSRSTFDCPFAETAERFWALLQPATKGRPKPTGSSSSEQLTISWFHA